MCVCGVFCACIECVLSLRVCVCFECACFVRARAHVCVLWIKFYLL